MGAPGEFGGGVFVPGQLARVAMRQPQKTSVEIFALCLVAALVLLTLVGAALLPYALVKLLELWFRVQNWSGSDLC